MLDKLEKYYSLKLELIPLLLLGIIVYLIISNYMALPDRFPIDFGPQGSPQDWAGKNMVYLYPGIGSLVYILITGLSLAFALVEDPRTLINLPNKWKASISDASIEELRAVMIRNLFALKVIIQALMGYLLYVSIGIALEKADRLETFPFIIFMAAILGIAGFMVWRTFKLVNFKGNNTN